MLAIRQRSTSKTNASYARLAQEEDETSPILYSRKPVKKEIPKSKQGAKVAFVLSVAGVVYLSTIAYMLRINSIYIKMSEELNNKKPELVRGVVGAIFMYFLCACVSLWMMYRTPAPSIDDSEDLSEK